jgi:hypothetical protein
MGWTDRWLERRVGSLGRGRALILDDLRRRFAAGDCGTSATIGLDERSLLHFSQWHRFDELALQFPTRGETQRLIAIARFGAQLADIAWSVSRRDARDDLLVEGALFNVGVALFDTVVDDQPQRRVAVAASLGPALLRRHVVDGFVLPNNRDAGIETLVDLFRFLFDRIYRRCLPPHRAHLAGLLEEMYRCETGSEADPIRAKVLPTAFIGQLPSPPALGEARLLHQLGVFVALVDDWQDLATDIQSGAANSLLDGASPATRAATTVRRMFGSQASHNQIRQTLASRLGDILQFAASLGSETESRTRAFLAGLLGVNDDS